MNDSCTLWLEKQENTLSCGASLAGTLYSTPLTLLLSGELGSGKTTFLQGFGNGLGIHDHLTSPTYALEQRYPTRQWGELIHLDLYRLRPSQARELILASDDHAGIRCIEWPERLELDLATHFPSAIHLHLSEENNGRRLTASFRDISHPSPARIAQWQSEVRLPLNIVKHCHAVASVCQRVATSLLSRGILVRPNTATIAGELHDLLRFIDFSANAAPPGITHSQANQAVWNEWRKKYPSQRHEDACGLYLHERGFPVLADIVAVHGVHHPPSSRTMIEQKILFYADKRVKDDEIVSVDERFADFRVRYGQGKDSPASQRWYDESKALERELFPNGVPF